MTSRTDELEQFKTDIDLRIVADELGYELNVKKSSRGSTAMDRGPSDRILVALAPDGHFVYCSVHDPADAGSVIDLWQRRRGGTLGEVRKALRPFLGAKGMAPPPLSSGRTQSMMLPNLRPVERDILGVQARYQGFNPLGGYHPYLCDERAFPPEILSQDFLVPRLRIDDRGNAIFPHFNDSGLCGFEARNHDFVSFSAGGTKGLFCTVPGPDDRTLVIAESAIDAISYGVISGHHRTRFISFSGGLNNEQPALLRQAMDKMPTGSAIIAAVDHDDAGDAYIDQLETLFDSLARHDLSFKADRPAFIGADWNDDLKARASQPDGGGRPAPNTP
ncbi:MAG: DUF3991 and TOPRIM domain-containing protein [Planctomycetota bacterium]